MPNWRQNTKKYKGRVVLRGDIVKRRFRVLRSVVTEQGSSASKMTAAKVMDIISRLPGCAGQAAAAVSAYTQVKMEDAHKLFKNSKNGVSRHLDSSTTTQMAKIMVQYGRPSRSSWSKSVRSSFGRTFMGKAIWENPIETRFEEGFQLVMFIRTPWKRIILICVCGWHKIGWKDTKHWSDVESTQLRSWFGRTNIIPWSCFPGVYSKTLWNKQRYCRQLQNHVPIAKFRGESRKITIPSKYSYFFMVLWHGWSCKEVCGTILWVCKQNDTTTLQRVYSMHRWPSLQRRRIEIRGRLVKSMLSNCSEIFIWHVLEHLILYVQWTNLHERAQNGPKHVTKDYLVWSLTFIIHVNTRLWTSVKFVQHLTQFKNESNPKEWLMIWTLLILFPHTSILLTRKLCCLCLKTTKQWSRWSLREEVRQWDMFPEPTELLLIGYSIESIWTPESKSNTLTPKTNSQTY